MHYTFHAGSRALQGFFQPSPSTPSQFLDRSGDIAGEVMEERAGVAPARRRLDTRLHASLMNYRYRGPGPLPSQRTRRLIPLSNQLQLFGLKQKRSSSFSFPRILLQ